MIEVVLFDMDGTIVDSEKINLEALNIALSRYDLPQISKEEYEIAFSMKDEDVLKYLNIEEDKIHEILEVWDTELTKLRDESPAFPGLLEVIDTLFEEGYKLGIITSRVESALKYDVERFKLDKYFDVMIAADQVENPKPSRDSLNAYIKKTGAEEEKIFFIGDSIHDSEFAKNCNIPFGLALWGTVDPDISATVKFSEAYEILDYVRNN